MEGNLTTKVGGRKVIHSQAREIVAKVYHFMKRESEANAPINLKKVQERVLQATGISESSLRRILKEDKNCRQAGTSFSTPNKIRRRKSVKSDLDNFDVAVVRRTVNDFHRQHGERPTLKSLLRVLRENIDFKGSKWALSKILKKIGFHWKKSTNNRKILVERFDIRELRLNYLRKLTEYRGENRPIIYMDETYVHSTHSTPNAWTDTTSNAGLKTPVSKGQRLIIVHGGGEDGFVKDALLTFKSGKKSGDYHNDMNYENYERWVRTKLIPNLKPNSVVVIDNAPYHNKQESPAPTTSTRKAEMIKWLSDRNIAHSNTMYKPELYSIIKMHKPSFKIYKIDDLFSKSGHTVLRLPPYHPDLNPIELIWSLLKGRVAKKNVTFNIDAVERLVSETCESITKDEWKKRCEHTRKIEEAYMELEPHIDQITEQIIIRLDEDSNSDDECDDGGEDIEPNSETSDDTGSEDHDLSGIVPFHCY